MSANFPRILIVFLLFAFQKTGFAQCEPFFPQPLSARSSNYDIHVTLDHTNRMLYATQTIKFTNLSPVAVDSLKMYLYLNAFKNTESTFLKGANNIFGRRFDTRKPEEWGWCEVENISRENGADLSPGMAFVKTKFNPFHESFVPHQIENPKSQIENPEDQTVLSVPLDKKILPGETAVFHLKWKARVPKTIARAGYSRDSYFLCHWFPQLGVFEKDRKGVWGWNCHQFQRHTEFYADFGVYDVHLTTDKQFVVGASGCLINEKDNGNGTISRHYHLEDAIDFAWTANPQFLSHERKWKHVNMRLLSPPEHIGMADRYLKTLEFTLEYLEKHVGKYPYSTITVMDPPFHGLGSGLMEYPTFITVGTFYGMPEGIHTSESLLVHEFTHQYFMGMVSSNEKEEAWLDEGFVTYFEDRIIDALFGKKKALIDVLGYQFDNKELSRIEYTTMDNPRDGPIARPGWFFESAFKELIYAKTATTLRTVENILGTEKMDKIIQGYFEKWKFGHPRSGDFMSAFAAGLAQQTDSLTAKNIYQLFETAIFKTKVLDYAVSYIGNENPLGKTGLFGAKASEFKYEKEGQSDKIRSFLEVQRKGDWVFPVEIRLTFEDGSVQTQHWSGEEGAKIFEFSGNSRLISAQIDPEQKIALDLDLNNNSMTLKPDEITSWKYGAKTIFWIQNLFQTVSVLI